MFNFMKLNIEGKHQNTARRFDTENYEDISETKKFKELLEQIPEAERAKVEEAIRSMVKDFTSQVIEPLQGITRK